MIPTPATASVYSELAASLRTRLAIIADRESYIRDPAAHLLHLKTVSEKVIAIQGRLPVPVNSHLAHYLDRCSYGKALDWLEENAGC